MNEYILYNSTTSKKDLEKLHIFISDNALVQDGVTLYFNSCILGDSIIYTGAVIHNNSVIEDSIVHKNVNIYSSRLEKCEIDENSIIGPFANLKSVILSKDCKIANFVEMKDVVCSKNVKISHLSSISHTEIGKNTTIAGGVIFSTTDEKRIFIGDDVKIGANASLIAPLTVQDGAEITAGSIISKDVGVNEIAKTSATQKNSLRAK